MTCLPSHWHLLMRSGNGINILIRNAKLFGSIWNQQQSNIGASGPGPSATAILLALSLTQRVSHRKNRAWPEKLTSDRAISVSRSEEAPYFRLAKVFEIDEKLELCSETLHESQSGRELGSGAFLGASFMTDKNVP